MGPTNVALVKLFQADLALRQANERYDSAAKSVRLIERRITDLSEKLKLTQGKLRELRAAAGSLELDIKTRESHIEKLRGQQQNARNNKEYQTLLSEISTGKIDRGKVEEEALKVLEQVERLGKEERELSGQLEEERKKEAATQLALGGRLAELQGEIEALRPLREQAAAAVPPRARDAFERLADRHEGEGMAALAKPHARYEEYICTVCNMSLVTDIYNRLHTRDELIFCPSCHRILYIPDDLPPETAVHLPGNKGRKAAGDKPKRAPAKKTTRAATTPASSGAAAATPGGATPAGAGRGAGAGKAAAPKSPWADLLWAAQGESTTYASEAGQPPVECEVTIDGKAEGVYRGRSADNLQKVIQFRMKEANRAGEVAVTERRPAKPEAPEAEAPAEGPRGKPAAEAAPPAAVSPVNAPAPASSPATAPETPSAGPAAPPPPPAPPAAPALASAAAPTAPTQPAAPPAPLPADEGGEETAATETKEVPQPAPQGETQNA